MDAILVKARKGGDDVRERLEELVVLQQQLIKHLQDTLAMMNDPREPSSVLVNTAPLSMRNDILFILETLRDGKVAVLPESRVEKWNPLHFPKTPREFAWVLPHLSECETDSLAIQYRCVEREEAVASITMHGNKHGSRTQWDVTDEDIGNAIVRCNSLSTIRNYVLSPDANWKDVFGFPVDATYPIGNGVARGRAEMDVVVFYDKS